MRRLLTVVVLLALIAFTVVRFDILSGPPTTVLFIGNSHTSANGLASMVDRLAASVGENLSVDVVAPDGAWWRDHVASQVTLDAIASQDWDFVVIQEQSMAPAVPDIALRDSLPSAITLATAARQSGATVVLFQTWGHRGGSSVIGLGDYSSMQIALAEGYRLFKDRLLADLAPVGAAWWITRTEEPGIDLYQADGIHPSREGSYLAAAVIASTILDADPKEFDDSQGLSEGLAVLLRGFAARAVKGEVPWQR